MPLSKENEETLEEMLSYLIDSQDPNYREAHPKCREGVGLAAPQIGKNLRMLVVHYLKEEGEVTHCLVNPKVIANSVKKCYLSSGEGCLSVDSPHPGYVYRDYRITVKAYDSKLGFEVTIRATGFDAIVLQHELDHLDGILFYDRIDKENPMKIIPGAIAI